MGESYHELMAEAGLLLNRGRLAQALMTCETWRNEGRVSPVDAALVAARVNLDAARPSQALEKILEVAEADTEHLQVDLQVATHLSVPQRACSQWFTGSGSSVGRSEYPRPGR